MISLEHITTNRGERNFSQVFEQYGVEMTRRDILPGHYYQLRVPVPNLSETMIPNSREEWKLDPNMYITDRNHYNMIPVGLSLFHNKWQENAIMLDLKVIPIKYRAKLILTHLNLIESSLDRIGAFTEDILPFKERMKLNMPMYNVTPLILEQASGIKLRDAISAYKLDKVDSAKLLDWNNIGELPMANLDVGGIITSPGVMDATSILEQFENKQMI